MGHHHSKPPVYYENVNVNKYNSNPISGNWNNLVNIALNTNGDKYNLSELRYTLGQSELERKLRDPGWWNSNDGIQAGDTISINLLGGENKWTPANAYKLFNGIDNVNLTNVDGKTVVAGKCVDSTGSYIDCAQGLYVPGCPVGYTSNYRCGDSSNNKTINISSNEDGAWLKTAIYDCNEENRTCLDTKLILLDTGILQIQHGEDKSYNITNETVPDTAVSLAKYKSEQGKFKKNYLVPGEILTAVDNLENIGDNFLGSPNGKCRLVLFNSGGTYQFLIIYSEFNCEKNSSGNYIGLDSKGLDSLGNFSNMSDNAVYSVPKVDAAQIGEVGYITNDLQLRQYPSGMVKKGGKEYFSIGNYSSSDELATLSNVSLSDCKNECNKNNKCYGFSYNKTAKTATLYGENMYGVNTNGKRIFNEDLELFIRSKIIDNNDSCNKEVNSITGVEWNAYNKGDVMSKDTLCQVADYIENQRQITEKEGEKLKNIGKEMKSELTKLTNEEKKLVNNMGFNVDKLSKQLIDYNDTQYSLEHANKHNANLSAMNEDTNLRMQSENYQYLLWSILAILIIIYGIRSSRS
jgi:hypothetical protein